MPHRSPPPNPSPSHQEELLDQFLLCGCAVAGLWLVRPPAGSALDATLRAARRLVGAAAAAAVLPQEWALGRGLGFDLGA
jgi:hypothetical protein